MSVTITSVNVVTSSLTTDEKRAMKYMIDQENARRAALDPPGAPLPTSTANERKTSYETTLVHICNQATQSYIEQAKENVTNKELKEAYAAANDSTKDQVNTLLGITGP